MLLNFLIGYFVLTIPFTLILTLKVLIVIYENKEKDNMERDKYDKENKEIQSYL